MKDVKRVNTKSTVLSKTKSVYGSAVGAKRKEHATALRSLKKKIGRKAYVQHRLLVAKNSEGMRKR